MSTKNTKAVSVHPKYDSPAHVYLGTHMQALVGGDVQMPASTYDLLQKWFGKYDSCMVEVSGECLFDADTLGGAESPHQRWDHDEDSLWQIEELRNVEVLQAETQWPNGGATTLAVNRQNHSWWYVISTDGESGVYAVSKYVSFFRDEGEPSMFPRLERDPVLRALALNAAEMEALADSPERQGRARGALDALLLAVATKLHKNPAHVSLKWFDGGTEGHMVSLQVVWGDPDEDEPVSVFFDALQSQGSSCTR